MPTYTLRPQTVISPSDMVTDAGSPTATALVNAIKDASDATYAENDPSTLAASMTISAFTNLPTLGGGESVTSVQLFVRGMRKAVGSRSGSVTVSGSGFSLGPVAISTAASPTTSQSSAASASEASINAATGGVSISSGPSNTGERLLDAWLVVTTTIAVPVNTTPPALMGGVANWKKGGTLTGSNGVWTNSPTGYTYRWFRNGVAISGATASTYTVVEADRGKSITFGVIASNGGGAGTETISTTTAVIVAEVQNMRMMI